jgi:hypothetical protein
MAQSRDVAHSLLQPVLCPTVTELRSPLAAVGLQFRLQVVLTT